MPITWHLLLQPESLIFVPFSVLTLAFPGSTIVTAFLVLMCQSSLYGTVRSPGYWVLVTGQVDLSAGYFIFGSVDGTLGDGKMLQLCSPDFVHTSLYTVPQKVCQPAMTLTNSC